MITHTVRKEITETWEFSEDDLIRLIREDLGTDDVVVDFSLDQAGCTARAVHKRSEMEG